jgi:V/A-type H+-transporting ATPase subunit C
MFLPEFSFHEYFGLKDGAPRDEYARPIGIVRALEAKLLKSEKLRDMEEARTVSDSISCLDGTPYERTFSGLKEAMEFEEAYERILSEDYRLIEELLVEKSLLNLMRMRYDFRNLKILLRHKLSGEEQPHPQSFSALGTIPPDKLLAVIKLPIGELIEELPEGYREGVRTALNIYELSKEPNNIDFTLNRTMFDLLLSSLPETSDYNFFRDLFAIEIDEANIMTLLRKKVSVGEEEVKEKFIERAFIPGGTIKKGDMVKLMKEGFPQSSKTISQTPYYNFIGKGLLYFDKTGSLFYLEKLFKDYINGFVKENSMLKNLDPEPIMAYLMAKENEVGYIRLILVAKAKNVPKEKIVRMISR